MTKNVRIENADEGPAQLTVVMEMQNTDGTWEELPGTYQVLGYPTAMMSMNVWHGTRIVIKELE